MSKSVFTNVNILFQKPSAVSGSFPYENTETDWVEQKQKPSWKDKKEAHLLCSQKQQSVWHLFPFRLMVKSKPWHFKELKDSIIHVSCASYQIFSREPFRIRILNSLRSGKTHTPMSDHAPICQIQLLQLWYLLAPLNKEGTV